jgi:pyruvate dehydrogenase E2 component (dihydrolipoamide acetyltransferase)
VVEADLPERALSPKGPAELPTESRAVFASPLAARLAAQCSAST